MSLTISKTNRGYFFIKKDGTQVKKIIDNKILNYIKRLTIPPAYKRVRIFYCENNIPKILYTGIDSKGRLQRIYSSEHRKKQDKLKLCKLYYLSTHMDDIKKKINKGICQIKLTQNKVICMVLKLMLICYFRLGNMKYFRLYHSIGTISIQKKHIKINKNGILHIKFPGKKGIINYCKVENKTFIKELINIMDGLNNNEFIFKYLDNGVKVPIRAIDVNYWLNSFNKNITSKLFRSYSANIFFIDYVNKFNKPERMDKKVRNRVTISAIKTISERIHNSSKIFKKNYLNSDLLDMYINKPDNFSTMFINGKSSKINFEKYIKVKCNI